MNICRTTRQFIMALAVFGVASLSNRPNAGEVDVLAITHDYVSLPRTLIVVIPVPQPSKPDGKLQIAETLGTIMTEELVGAIQRELPTAHVVSNASASAAGSGLVVESRFSKLVPGSSAKRFWLGFGAGKSVTEISGEVRDLVTGNVVARFTHARLSWCCGFGSNDHEIRSNLVNAASDIAAVIAGHFEAAQSYTWLQDELTHSAQPQTGAPLTSGGHLVIEASAEHAEVLADGKYLGATPLEVTLSVGSHNVVVRKTGFHDWTRDVEILEGSKQKVWADLEPDGNDR